ncbi:unnamed protein product [Chironomus riparius]|uniref:Uncharacterized protein n=1 Tax=Chironomus riparius TaxID=315576 RepID=A0A9N9WRS7_9DIPT|nr:unnamed protein product [Chironomus riparius]
MKIVFVFLILSIFKGTDSSFVYPDSPILKTSASSKESDDNVLLSAKMNCEFFSEDGDCLGELQDDTLSQRCLFSTCSFGHKTDQYKKCRKVLTKELGIGE